MPETLPDNGNRILTGATLLKVGEQYYETRPLISSDFRVGGQEDFVIPKEFTMNKDILLKPDIAYLLGEYYYFFRGSIKDMNEGESPLPGIYFDEENRRYLLCEPDTPEECAQYRYTDKITSYDADEIRNAVLNHEVVIFNTPDKFHSSIPPESISDDILKKLIKRAISDKGVDLDRYRVRFASKNMLFNTKQVLRGPNRLSMLLFDRCTEALNLKYTIIIEEGGGEIVGNPLSEKIVISSHDTYDANASE